MLPNEKPGIFTSVSVGLVYICIVLGSIMVIQKFPADDAKEEGMH